MWSDETTAKRVGFAASALGALLIIAGIAMGASRGLPVPTAPGEDSGPAQATARTSTGYRSGIVTLYDGQVQTVVSAVHDNPTPVYWIQLNTGAPLIFLDAAGFFTPTRPPVLSSGQHVRIWSAGEQRCLSCDSPQPDGGLPLIRGGDGQRHPTALKIETSGSVWVDPWIQNEIENNGVYLSRDELPPYYYANLGPAVSNVFGAAVPVGLVFAAIGATFIVRARRQRAAVSSTADAARREDEMTAGMTDRAEQPTASPVSAPGAFIAAGAGLLVAAGLEVWFLADLHSTMSRYAAQGGYCSSESTMEAGQPGLFLLASLALLLGGVMCIALGVAASRQDGRRGLAIGVGAMEVVASLPMIVVNLLGPFGPVLFCHLG